MVGPTRTNRLIPVSPVSSIWAADPLYRRQAHSSMRCRAKDEGHLPLSCLILAESRDLVRAAALG